MWLGELVTQPLLLLRGQIPNTGTWDSPSHLLNAAGGPSFLLYFIWGPSVHLLPLPLQQAPGDQQYNALFHHMHQKPSEIFCKLYQEGVENRNIPKFQFLRFDKNL